MKKNGPKLFNEHGQPTAILVLAATEMHYQTFVRGDCINGEGCFVYIDRAEKLRGIGYLKGMTVIRLMGCERHPEFREINAELEMRTRL